MRIGYYIMKTKDLIDRLQALDYRPYDFTFTFRTSELSKIYTNQEIFYADKKYSVFFENRINSHNKYIELVLRKTLNVVSNEIVYPRNPGRKLSNELQPIFFYNLELMKKDKYNKESSRRGKENINISPVHVHGTALVPKASLSRWSFFIGKNKIIHDRYNKALKGVLSSYIRPLNSQDECDRWFGYSTKEMTNDTRPNHVYLNSSYNWQYPDFFARAPEAFIEALQCRTEQPYVLEPIMTPFQAMKKRRKLDPLLVRRAVEACNEHVDCWR